MRAVYKGLFAAACALTLTGLSAGSASAYIACNRDGDCWHVRERHHYRPEFGVIIHPDNWKWRARERYRWREHEGRGYWRQGVWIGF